MNDVELPKVTVRLLLATRDHSRDKRHLNDQKTQPPSKKKIKIRYKTSSKLR